MTTPTHPATVMTDPTGTPHPPHPGQAPTPGTAPEDARTEQPPAVPDSAPSPAVTSPAPAVPEPAADASSRRRPRTDTVLTAVVTVLGTAFIALLVYEFNKIDDRFDRIDDRFVRLDEDIDDRFVRLEEDIDDRFDKMDARFAALEEDVGEIALALTALAAHLNAKDAVDAALEGRLLIPGATDPRDGSTGPASPP